MKIENLDAFNRSNKYQEIKSSHGKVSLCKPTRPFFVSKLKVTVQFERCFWLMEHISVISCRNSINLYITEKLIKFSKLLYNCYLVILNKQRERTPCFPTFVFPLRNSKSDVLRLMASIIAFSYLSLFAVQNRVSVF